MSGQRWEVRQGDALELLEQLEPGDVDSIRERLGGVPLPIGGLLDEAKG